MKNIYYSYSKEELLKNPKIEIVVMDNDQMVFRAMAEEMIAEIQRNNQKNQRTVLICPVGPVGQYSFFVDAVNERKIDLKNVWFINMDEYITEEGQWIDIYNPLSFRGFMKNMVYDRILPELIMPEKQRIFPDPNHPEYILSILEKLGGVDICFGGIGINGHIAFNEPDKNLSPEEFLKLPTRVLDITPETRTVNAVGSCNGALDLMPKQCITIGFREILMSKKIRLGCFRDWHRAVIRHAAYGEISTYFPVTLLQNHPDISIRCTELVANLS